MSTVVPVLALCVLFGSLGFYLAKRLWWDHRASAARLSRSKELVAIIRDPNSGWRPHAEAGIELYGIDQSNPELAAKLRRPETWKANQ